MSVCSCLRSRPAAAPQTGAHRAQRRKLLQAGVKDPSEPTDLAGGRPTLLVADRLLVQLPVQLVRFKPVVDSVAAYSQLLRKGPFATPCSKYSRSNTRFSHPYIGRLHFEGNTFTVGPPSWLAHASQAPARSTDGRVCNFRPPRILPV